MDRPRQASLSHLCAAAASRAGPSPGIFVTMSDNDFKQILDSDGKPVDAEPSPIKRMGWTGKSADVRLTGDMKIKADGPNERWLERRRRWTQPVSGGINERGREEGVR